MGLQYGTECWCTRNEEVEMDRCDFGAAVDIRDSRTTDYCCSVVSTCSRILRSDKKRRR